MKQRNAYLKTMAINSNTSNEYLEILTKKLIEYGDSAEKIALVTGLSQETIVQLQNEIAQQ